MNYHIDQVNWVGRPYIKLSDAGPVHTHPFKYHLILPDFLASWDVWDYWEKERTFSLKDNLSHGEILWDIGSEVGWLSVVYAKFVGPENVVLIEPTPEFWGNIKHTWLRNCNNVMPRASFDGLLGDVDEGEPIWHDREFPANAEQDLIDKMAYRYVHNNQLKDPRPVAKIDTLVERFGVVPDALTMDTEGSEMLILKGAENTLRNHKPKVWVSVHPDLGLRDYGTQVGEVKAYMESLGYTGEHLSTDHEEHWFFRAG